MLELFSLFLAPLLVNVLSELFKLWIKRRSTLLEGSKKPHRWHEPTEKVIKLMAFLLY